MTTSPAPKIGVVVCSQRSPRIGDQVGTLIYTALNSLQPTNASSPTYSLSVIDLADHTLPFFDEPIIPQMITNPADYHHEHTRAWSKLISSYSAFVFVTPQYNWSFPANLKNAIDYLFNEWVGKPAMIVSYGGHGGGYSAGQLTQVLQAVRMKVAGRSVGLTFPKQGADGKEFLKKSFKGMDLELAGDDEERDGVWSKEMEDVKEVFGELVGMLQNGVEKEKQ